MTYLYDLWQDNFFIELNILVPIYLAFYVFERESENVLFFTFTELYETEMKETYSEWIYIFMEPKYWEGSKEGCLILL